MNDEFVVDGRTAEDLRKQFSALAAAYTPEWKFDAEHPDVGSVLALIFTRQMERNLSRLNQVIPKFHTEFVNMLSISLLPAQPARGVVLMNLIRDTIPGVDVPMGTQLLGRGEDEELPVVFETLSDVHITNAGIDSVLLIAPQAGKILSLLGGPGMAKLHEGENLPPAEERTELRPFRLFDCRDAGVGRSALLLYHKTMFESAGDTGIVLSMTDAASGEKLGERFADPARYRWRFLDSGQVLSPFDSVTAENGDVVLVKKRESGRETLGGQEFALIALEPVGPVEQTVELGEILLKSSCGFASPAFLSHNEEELSGAEWLPFGETASLFDECYIGDDRIFSQQGARVSMRFFLSFREKLVTFSPQEEEDQLKVIKRKPRAVYFDTARTEVQRVAVEYFNGNGWRRLELEQDVSTLFSGDRAGEYELSFRCPEDWQELSIGGYRGRSLRLRVAQADNCYLQPCVHRMPVVRDFALCYAYTEGAKSPQRVRKICGTAVEDLTEDLLSGRPIAAFSPLPYAHSGLYLGFDRPVSGAPVSLLFEVEQCAVADPAELEFEYSAAAGFKPLKVLDQTENLSNLGTVMFAPPSDFAAFAVEGVKRWWVRILDKKGAYDAQKRFRPTIRAIHPNAVPVHNVETLPRESFYIDFVRPGMSFPLAAQNILSADVFVNEKAAHTAAVMRRMAKERPEDVRISYDFLGDVEEFFVRWKEVESFAASAPTDRHYMIDRMANRIVFGDGINVAIPRAQNEEAFRVTVRCCRGEGGNLPAGAIDSAMSRLLHIDRIENPVDTWSGTNLESVEKAHRRGAGMLCSQNRLFSRQDYLREVCLYSSSIEKVGCVLGRDVDGRRDDRLVNLLVMMRDYQNGSYSFSSIRDRIRRGVLEKCEAPLTGEFLHVLEPVYVELSVTVFVDLPDGRETFAVQNLIQKTLRDYIDPFSESGEKWDIGRLPTEAQLRLLLNSVRSAGTIRKFMVTAAYSDKSGAHECGLSDLKATPFMIGVNGAHKIVVTLL